MAQEDRAYPVGESGKPRSLEQQHVEDGRRFSPSAARNIPVLKPVFEQLMPETGVILEIGSGTGEHGLALTEEAPGLEWTFTDISPDARESQAAWIAHSRRSGLVGPYSLNASASDWGRCEDRRYVGVVSINMIHIAPFKAVEGLFAGAGRVLVPGGRLFLYGPFARNGTMVPSNQSFDADLKRRDPDWGVRDLDLQLVPLATAAGLNLADVMEMPKNNLCVTFERT